MSAGQIAASHGRLRAPIVIALVSGAFAVGALAGFSLPRAASGAGIAQTAAGPVVQASTFNGVADNNMSDAADAALHGPTAPGTPKVNASTGFTTPATSKVNASTGFTTPATSKVNGSAPTFTGVADNNMSDAADRALHGAQPTFTGVADNNMSDAADEALHGLSDNASH